MGFNNIAAHGGRMWEIADSDPTIAARIISADVNNAFYPPSPATVTAIESQMDALHHLPDTKCGRLKAALADFHNLDERMIEVGAGSSDLLQTIITGFLRPGDNIVLPSFTYSEYERCARSVGAKVKKARLLRANGFAADVNAILDQVDRSTRMVLICNPNNPTGQVLKQANLKQLLRALDPNVWFIIDETYIDYSADDSMIAQTSLWPNLVVVRTFSKAYALAALRVGYAVFGGAAKERFTALVRRPWPVGQLSLAAAEAALSDYAYVKKMVSISRDLTDALVDDLNRSRRMTALPTQTNYFLLDLTKSGKSATEILLHLQKRMILLRECSSFGDELAGFLRITTQSEIDNRRIANALKGLAR